MPAMLHDHPRSPQSPLTRACQSIDRVKVQKILMIPRCPLTRHCVRVAQEMDSKSIGLCPQGFESPSLRRGHANLFCLVPSLTDDLRRESKSRSAPNDTCSVALPIKEVRVTRLASMMALPAIQLKRGGFYGAGRHSLTAIPSRMHRISSDLRS